MTGRQIHGGQDPVGLIDGAAIIILSVAVVGFTFLLYRWLFGSTLPLGIRVRARSALDFIVGLFTGFIFIIIPWLIALTTGRAIISDRIWSHYSGGLAAGISAFALLLLVSQSITEETANRAFPIRLWNEKSLLFRIFVPSLFFAALHLANEQFSLERFGILLMAGTLQSFAYLITGDIWLTSGVHFGANLASFSVSGLWHAGAIVSVAGQPAYPNWVAVFSLMIATWVTYIFLRRYKAEQMKPEG